MQAHLGHVSPWATVELLSSFLVGGGQSLGSWEELQLRDLPALGSIRTWLLVNSDPSHHPCNSSRNLLCRKASGS